MRQQQSLLDEGTGAQVQCIPVTFVLPENNRGRRHNLTKLQPPAAGLSCVPRCSVARYPMSSPMPPVQPRSLFKSLVNKIFCLHASGVKLKFGGHCGCGRLPPVRQRHAALARMASLTRRYRDTILIMPSWQLDIEDSLQSKQCPWNLNTVSLEYWNRPRIGCKAFDCLKKFTQNSLSCRNLQLNDPQARCSFKRGQLAGTVIKQKADSLSLPSLFAASCCSPCRAWLCQCSASPLKTQPTPCPAGGAFGCLPFFLGATPPPVDAAFRLASD
jgi:hypothetical protein